MKKTNEEEFVKRLFEVYGDEYVLVGAFHNRLTPTLFRHNKCNAVDNYNPKRLLRRGVKCKCQRFICKITNLDELNQSLSTLGYRVSGIYKGSSKNTEILHETCGNTFIAKPLVVLKGKSKCELCRTKYKKRTNEIFSHEIEEITAGEYKVISAFTSMKNKVVMFHKSCEREFETTGDAFINRGSRCSKCRYDNIGKWNKKSIDDFTTEFNEKKGNLYELIGEYTGSSDYIEIKCRTCSHHWEVHCGSFITTEKGCPKCFFNKLSKIKTKSHEQFVNQVVERFGNEFIVIGEYVGDKNKIQVIHNYCGEEFSISPGNLLRGKGCPICKMSKGERAIKKYLEDNSFEYTRQLKFPDCRNELELPFDFGVFDENGILLCLIEFDGKQHYEPLEIFGGERGFIKRKKNDQIKNNYCKAKGIKLIRIPYYEYKNINTLLSEALYNEIASKNVSSY